jgi:hypothetical protein
MGINCPSQVFYVSFVDLQTALNTAWKLDSLQMMILIYVCLTFSVVELKARLETSIERNVVYGVYSFHVQLICAIFGTY